MKYLINGEEFEQDEFYSKLEEAINSECEGTYDDYLDESNEDVCIGDLTFSPSTVLERCDPVAYRCGLSDYQSSELENAEYELYHSDFIIVGDSEFSIEEDDEEADAEEDAKE